MSTVRMGEFALGVGGCFLGLTSGELVVGSKLTLISFFALEGVLSLLLDAIGCLLSSGSLWVLLDSIGDRLGSALGFSGAFFCFILGSITLVK